jgi:hypothetical protein
MRARWASVVWAAAAAVREVVVEFSQAVRMEACLEAS